MARPVVQNIQVPVAPVNPFAPPPPPPQIAGQAGAAAGGAPCAGGAPIITVDLVDWCSTTALQDVQDALDQLQAPQEAWVFRRLAGFAPAPPPQLATFPDWVCAAFGPRPGYWPSILVSIIYMWLRIGDWMLSLVLPDLCDPGVMGALTVRSAIMGIAERWVGVDFGPARQSLAQEMNYACPQTVSDPGTVVSAYLHGTIDRPTAGKWCRASGWCDYTVTLAIDGAKWRPSPQDLVTWRNWDCLSHLTTLDQALQQTGMIDSDYRSAFICSSYATKGVGEIYRLLHECRPGAPAGRPTYTRDQATADLKKLGYSDTDVPYLLYLARTPLQHRQVLQPYYQGDISRQQLQSYLLDDGYDAADLAVLQPFYDAQATTWAAKEVGIPDAKGVIKGLVDGTLTSDVASSLLQQYGVPAAVQQVVGQVVQVEQQQAVRAAGIAAVRASLRAGELTGAAAIAELSAFQVPASAAQLIVQEWQIEAASAHKPISAGQLCSLTTQGLITVASMVQRLQAMGYSANDAEIIVSSCSLKEKQKAQKALATAQAKRVSAEQKAAAQAAALARAQAKLAAAQAAKVLKTQAADATRLMGAVGSVFSQVGTRATTANLIITQEVAEANPPLEPGQ